MPAFLAGLIICLAATVVHAGLVKDCLTACAPKLAACSSSCGGSYGVSDKACRKGIVKQCRTLGVSAACGSTTTTTLPCPDERSAFAEIDWEPDFPGPLVRVTVTARP